jgi:hypothetical protein
VFRRKVRSEPAPEVIADANDWLARSGAWITAGNFVSELGIAMSLVTSLGMAADISAASRLLEGWKAGHALRATVNSLVPPQPLPSDTMNPESVARLAGLSHNELLHGDDYERPLHELAAGLQPFTEERFGEIVSVNPELWNVTVQEAAQRLRHNVDRQLTPERAEPLLRAGYVLRALEEALALQPSNPPPVDD